MPRGLVLTESFVLRALPPLALVCAAALVLACGPAAASAAGPVQSKLPVLKDVMGRGAGVAAPDLPIGLGALPGARETAAYAAGRVAIAVVFLESDGSKMRSTENWSRPDTDNYPGQDRRQLILGKVQSALDWWNARSPDGSLQLFIPAAGSYGAPQTITTALEPIKLAVTSTYGGHPVLSDARWRWPAMRKLGFGHDVADDKPYPETLFADQVRTRNGADWAFVLYVVDSLKDPDGMFANQVVAYTADIFGPYSVLTYDNDGYGTENFGAVLAHEMGHVFGAVDEYEALPGYPSTGDITSGYLGVRNRNAITGGTTDFPCIMRGGDETLQAFARGQLCPSSVGQAGLRDSDADARPDVVDTRPVFTTGLETTDDQTGAVTLRGSVAEKPRPRGKISLGVYFRHDISIRVPHDVQYRVDGGAWLPLAAADGAFDEPAEAWSVTTDPLAAGHHTLELQGTTGETAGPIRDLWAGPTPVTLELAGNAAFTRSSVTISAGAQARVYVRSTSAGLPVPRLAPIKLRRLPDKKVAAVLTAGEDGVWTGTLSPARTRSFVASFAGAGQFGAATSQRITIVVR